jgi:hypothetical protein
VLEKDPRPGTSPRAFGFSRCASSTRFPGQASGSVEAVRFIDLTGFSHRVGNDHCLRIPAVHPVSSHCRALSCSWPQSTSDGLSCGPAHGPQKVEDGRLGADETLWGPI